MRAARTAERRERWRVAGGFHGQWPRLPAQLEVAEADLRTDGQGRAGTGPSGSRPLPKQSEHHTTGRNTHSWALLSVTPSSNGDGTVFVSHDRSELERYFRQSPMKHIFGLCDLDDTYWDKSVWIASRSDSQLSAVILIYTGFGLPVVMTFTEDKTSMDNLLWEAMPVLPRRFYAHLTNGAEDVLTGHGACVDHYGDYYRMTVTDWGAWTQATSGVDVSMVEQLTVDSVGELERLYKESYEGAAFDPSSVERGFYFGVRESGVLVAAVGVHALSLKYNVAVTGNLATRPDARRKGYGRAVVTRLRQELRRHGIIAAFNVRADNIASVNLHLQLGYGIVGFHREFMVDLCKMA